MGLKLMSMDNVDPARIGFEHATFTKEHRVAMWAAYRQGIIKMALVTAAMELGLDNVRSEHVFVRALLSSTCVCNDPNCKHAFNLSVQARVKLCVVYWFKSILELIQRVLIGVFANTVCCPPLTFCCALMLCCATTQQSGRTARGVGGAEGQRGRRE